MAKRSYCLLCEVRYAWRELHIVGCSTSRRHKGIGIFKVPLPNNEFNKKWNRDLIDIITKDRQVDEPLKKRIASCNLYICERHFSPEQIWKYPSRKVLKDGALHFFFFIRNFDRGLGLKVS